MLKRLHALSAQIMSSSSKMISVKPFQINITNSDLEDLKNRLSKARFPEQETVNDWSQGVPLKELKELCSYWADHYDWRKCEAWLNESGQHMASIDGYDIHFLHIRSPHDNALPLLLLHGWPGSILEFRKASGPLVDPTAHGGNAEDAFHLIIPSMPGYGFSSKPTTTGTNRNRICELYIKLMEGLGYDRWVAQGGDWGGDILVTLGSRYHPKSLAAIHLNFPFFNAIRETADKQNLSQEEQVAVDKTKKLDDLMGYYKQQSTRPQTIGYSLADSPVGQAAWIYEKIHDWTDNDGDVSKVLTKDEILDNIMMYWLTNTGASSARKYWEKRQENSTEQLKMDVPIGLTNFPGELTSGTKEWAQKYYSNLIHWNKTDAGGHFAAWEVPELFVKEVRDCFRKVRQ